MKVLNKNVSFANNPTFAQVLLGQLFFEVYKVCRQLMKLIWIKDLVSDGEDTQD